MLLNPFYPFTFLKISSLKATIVFLSILLIKSNLLRLKGGLIGGLFALILISGIIAIGSGFPLGPEGPSVQMGGSVAWQMAKWLKAPTAFRRVIVAAGGGAGIAAVFSVH